ncbi:hypothetical protein [Schlesneria sp. T3-172]|uniref:hypothetical protein n=1 Tax=Schlesneria sphaerica TaxID=3373610 RepID=UPI0037CA161D
MPMTIKVGLAKKLGQPDFGSLGASCDIELELDGAMLFHDLSGLHEKIQQAYLACRQAVNDELAGQTRKSETPSTTKAIQTNGQVPVGTPDSPSGSNRHAVTGKSRAATASQVRALHAIATRQGFALADRLKDQYQVFRAEDLSIAQASRLIDDLNQSTSVAATKPGGQA